MSLRSIVQKGRFYCDWSKNPAADEQFRDACLFLTRRANDRNTVLVNAQSVYDDLIPGLDDRDDEAWLRLVNYPAIPQPMPPYEHMWLEARVEDPRAPQRLAAVTTRCDAKHKGLAEWSESLDDSERQMILEDNPATVVVVSLIRDWNGSASLAGRFDYWLDGDGRFLRSARLYIQGDTPLSEKARKVRIAQIKLLQGWVLHTFARMNCANSRLVEMPNGFKPKHGRRHPHAPYSVWHEIQVSDAPKIRHASVTTQENHESVRFHSVRGHYADYTRGAGLFGNPKLRKVFWIPEHHAGSEEAGSVASSYSVS